MYNIFKDYSVRQSNDGITYEIVAPNELVYEQGFNTREAAERKLRYLIAGQFD